MPRFSIKGHRLTAERVEQGIPINPALPKNFDNTPNEERLDSFWWHQPFIVVQTVEDWDKFYQERKGEYAAKGLESWQNEGRAMWMKAWPSGNRYDVRCLDGGAWDRSTNWGMYATLQEALETATQRNRHPYGLRGGYS